jgi:DNA-binding response OmpR family regulator
MKRHKRILIVDDDRRLVESLAVRLRAEGYQIIRAEDGYQALQSARRGQPDLVLLDIHMPAGDGFSVQNRMHQITNLATTPVIYLTGETSGSVDAMAHDHGAFKVLHKPFNTEHLLEAVRSALGDTSHRAETQHRHTVTASCTCDAGRAVPIAQTRGF